MPPRILGSAPKPCGGKNGFTFLCQLENDSKDVSTLIKIEQKKTISLNCN